MGNRRVWMQYVISPFKTYRREIAQQKEKLHLSQRRFDELLKSGNDLICIIGPDGTYKYVSPSAKQVLNTEPDYYIGKTTFEFMHPDDIPRIISSFEYVLTTEEQVHIPPFRFRNSFNEWCWLDSYATNRSNDPAVLGVVINARDISIKIKDEQEKLLSAEKLKLSNERYELVAKATSDIIWDWDLESNQISRVKGFEKLSGLSHDNETPVSEPWDKFIHPDDKERVLLSISAATNNPDEQYWQSEYRFIKYDGSLAFIIDRGYIVRDSENKAIRMVGAMHDNTELKEKELRIVKQNEQMSEIAQINSHVIRKPVANILGLIDLLDKESITEVHDREILKHLLASTKELDAVIRQINNKAFE
jgi:PAS domain S-box-containing protein